jgi:osmotically inducible protein OsmC
MKVTKTASAQWRGGLKDGKGSITTESGALSAQPYGFNTRFEGVKGTNPEELLGAAHAGCFTMALSLMLGEAGFKPEQLDTTAKVTLEQVAGGFEITAVHLTLKARVPGIDEAGFRAVADKAKSGCPLSKVIRAPISLEASLA